MFSIEYKQQPSKLINFFLPYEMFGSGLII